MTTGVADTRGKFFRQQGWHEFYDTRTDNQNVIGTGDEFIAMLLRRFMKTLRKKILWHSPFKQLGNELKSTCQQKTASKEIYL